MTSITMNQASDLIRELVGLGGWRSDRDAVFEAMPHLSQEILPEDILSTLDNLNIAYSTVQCRQSDITEADCPALVIPDKGSFYLALDRQAGCLHIQQVGQVEPQSVSVNREKCQIVVIERFYHKQPEDRPQTVAEIFGVLRGITPGLIMSSFLVNILGLFTPLLIMVIYDRVIPSGSSDLLFSLLIGVVIILASDFMYRLARVKSLAHAGRQIERQLTVSLFQKLMSLPLVQLQKSDTEQQLSRFRQFESLRELFTGQVMTSLLDLPFVLIFIAVLFYIAPPVGLLTVAVIVFFACVSAITIPQQRRLNQAATEASAAHKLVVQDALKHQRVLVNLGMSGMWSDRCETLAESAEATSRTARQVQTALQSLAQTATVLTTAGAIVLSAYAAMAGDMSFGALIAVIALVSKVLGPIHALHANIPQILSFRQSRSQADRVLALPEEMELGLEHSLQNAFAGDINFASVTHRPDAASLPVLSQVSFRCQPQETVVVMGNDLSSRTAVLDLIDGFYHPLAGSIEHDGIDIRQIARDELRRSVSYCTFKPSLFYGTIAQNFRLACPSLTDQSIKQALFDIGLTDQIDALAEGVDTRLDEDLLARLPSDTLKAIVLARCMARLAPIHLFAEPTSGLGHHLRDRFKSWITAQQGDRTIIVATADKSFLPMADRFIFLDEGRITVNDTGQTGLKKITAALRKHEG